MQNNLLLRNGTEISTQAGTEATGGGDGGNITIDAQLIVAFPKEDSNINANAFDGKGGNIDITAQNVFGFELRDRQTPLSDITASSTRGVDGEIEINQLGVDPVQGLVILPENLTDSSTQIAVGCAADAGNSFVITGRGGLPEDPTQTLRGRTVWRDLGQSDRSFALAPEKPQPQPSTQNQRPAANRRRQSP